MRPLPWKFDLATSAPKIDVDNRFPLRFYYRISDNLLKQADIFREEENIVDLYVMLLRFSSLVSETIPCHREYKAFPQSFKSSARKKLLNAISESEKLKPEVLKKIDELNRKVTYQANGALQQNGSCAPSLEWPPLKKQSRTTNGIVKTPHLSAQQYAYQNPRPHQFATAKPVQDQYPRFIPRPKEETLSRHSILGPNGLNGQWQPPRNDKRVQIQYPSNIDFTPVEIPRENSLQQFPDNGIAAKKPFNKSNDETESLESVLSLSEDNKMHNADEPCSMISFESLEIAPEPDIIRQPSPPPVLAEVQDLVHATPPVSEAQNGIQSSSPDDLISSESPMQLHISSAVMDSFMKLAKSNTDKNLETCGVLAGVLKNRKFFVSALIIPKQESTSDSCQTTNEEEIFDVQDKQSLFPLGWIHTHPTQSCFMSSIDVHTHYSYQVMLQEAIAIVMAPKDSSRKHGIFRLTTPGGMTTIRHCPRRGFHPHDPPSDGSPIYKQCTDVYMNPSLKFDIIDLR